MVFKVAGRGESHPRHGFAGAGIGAAGNIGSREEAKGIGLDIAHRVLRRQAKLAESRTGHVCVRLLHVFQFLKTVQGTGVAPHQGKGRAAEVAGGLIDLAQLLLEDAIVDSIRIEGDAHDERHGGHQPQGSRQGQPALRQQPAQGDLQRRPRTQKEVHRHTSISGRALTGRRQSGLLAALPLFRRVPQPGCRALYRRGAARHHPAPQQSGGH